MKNLFDGLSAVKETMIDGIEKAFDDAVDESKRNHEAELVRLENAKNKAMGRVGVDIGGVLTDVEKDLGASPAEKEKMVVPAAETEENEVLVVGG